MREFLNYKLWSDITIGDFFTFIGIIAIILYVIDSLIKYFPFFQKLKVSTLDKAADTIMLRAIKKRAVSSGIELMLNQTVNELRNELPKGWINRASIKWIGKTLPADFQDKQLIMRIRPTDNNDDNYLNAIYYFFSASLFPESYTILPTTIKESSSLYMVKRTIEDKQPYLVDKFKKHFLNSISSNEPTVAGYYGDYLRIDEYGFFCSAFLREVDTLAKSLQFSRERLNIESEINNILNHLIKFEKLNKNFIGIGNDEWHNILSATSYGFILVAKPEEKRLNGIEPYVKRAKQKLKLGIRRLYVFGCHAELPFYNSVLLAIKDEIREYKLQETFRLYRDYRGEANGFGALFIIDTVREGLLKYKTQEEEIESDKIEPFSNLTTKLPKADSEVIISEEQLAQEIISIIQNSPQKDGWCFLGTIGNKLKTQLPLFNQYHYGCSSLKQLLQKLKIFEIREDGEETVKVVYIRLKTEHPTNQTKAEKQKDSNQLDEKSKMLLYLSSVISELSEEDGWTHLSSVGQRIKADFPDFDFKKFDSSNLLIFCESSGMFETKRTGFGPYKPVLIKLKGENSHTVSNNQPSIVAKEIVVSTIIQIVTKKCRNKEWAQLTQVGWDLKLKYPDFKPQQYGSQSFRHFLESTGKFQIKQEGEGERAVLYVKLIA